MSVDRGKRERPRLVGLCRRCRRCTSDGELRSGRGRPIWSVSARFVYPSTTKVWQTLNIGKSPRTPNNLIISGAAHGQISEHCLGVVCQTLPVLRYPVCLPGLSTRAPARGVKRRGRSEQRISAPVELGPISFCCREAHRLPRGPWRLCRPAATALLRWKTRTHSKCGTRRTEQRTGTREPSYHEEIRSETSNCRTEQRTGTREDLGGTVGWP